MWAITTQREEFTSRASYSPFYIVVLDDDGSVGGGMVVLVLMAEASMVIMVAPCSCSSEVVNSIPR